jgi:hypothetical protein
VSVSCEGVARHDDTASVKWSLAGSKPYAICGSTHVDTHMTPSLPDFRHLEKSFLCLRSKCAQFPGILCLARHHDQSLLEQYHCLVASLYWTLHSGEPNAVPTKLNPLWRSRIIKRQILKLLCKRLATRTASAYHGWHRTADNRDGHFAAKSLA